MKIGSIVGGVAPPIDKKQDQDEDDYESLFSDDDSTGSIFSSDEEEEMPSTLEALEIEFKARDKLLDRLVQGTNPTYARMMRENEQIVRTQKLLRLQQQEQMMNLDDRTSRTSISSLSTSDDHSDRETDAIVVVEGMDAPSRAFSFDMKTRLQGALILILNCIAYNGGEQIVRSFVVYLSENEEFEDLTFLPAMMILASFFVLCLTGGIFDYVNDDAYLRIKFDMNNRLYLGKWDAVVMKWFRKYGVVTTTLNVLAFFTVVYSVYTFQEHVMSWVFDIRYEVFQGLPSVQQGIMTYPRKMLAVGLEEDQVERVLGDAVCAMNKVNGDDLTRQDEAFLASKIAADCYGDLMGDTTASVVTEAVLFWYYAVSVLVAVVTLRMMGHKFWSI